MLHDINSCNYLCVCIHMPFSVNWEVVMVRGKCEQKVCSFQEQNAGKKIVHFTASFIFFYTFVTCLQSVSVYILPILLCVFSVVLSEQIGGLNAN